MKYYVHWLVPHVKFHENAQGPINIFFEGPKADEQLPHLWCSTLTSDHAI